MKETNKSRRKGGAFPHCAAAKPQKSMIKSNSRRSLVSVFLIVALAFGLVPALQGFHLASAQEVSPSPTPATPTVNKAELHQALLDLTNAFTVMCVAAHPDDEDGTTLTVLRRKHGVHTVSLFSTFGEGGQNAVGPELYEELGVIRTQETIKAAQIQGSEPFFLGMKDFGFSKSADETFKVWGPDEALRRMVLKIRELRPDAIITNHDTSRGHGHHQATGQLILEAFDAAADAKRFPEQLNQLKPWQTQRLFVRVFGGGTGPQPASQAGPEKTFAIDPNEIDPVRGTSFAEQALVALQQHASQGPWPKSIEELLRMRRIEAGKLPLIRYRLMREAKGAPSLPENATTPLAGLELPEAAEAFAANSGPPKIDGRPLTEFIDQPDRVLASLIDWRASQNLSDTVVAEAHRLRLMEDRVNKALGIASGVSLTLAARPAVLVPGTNTTFSVGITNSGARSVQVDGLRFYGLGEDLPLKAADHLLPDTETTVTVDRTIPKTAPLTVPKEAHLYDELFLGLKFTAYAELEIDGARFRLSAPLNVEVAPAVEIKSIAPSPYVWTPATVGGPWAFNLELINHSETPFAGMAQVSTGSNLVWLDDQKIQLQPNELRKIQVAPKPAFPSRKLAADQLRAKRAEVAIVAAGSRETITARRVPAVYVNARVKSGVRVGYISSFDETLKNSLAALDVEAKELRVDDVKNADLGDYQTIIIDNRGYEAHPELIAANSRLLDFVNAGGTLIVFYHKDNEWNPDPRKNRPQLAPYPITLGGERVTVETAPIRFSQPRHPLLNFPNRIGPADFKNWIQERGLYYPKVWDSHYTALFTTNDPGEAPLTGGLLVAQYGKGNYIYTSMVWYRQLRAGVPGAYRMFANMLSYGHDRLKATPRKNRISPAP